MMVYSTRPGRTGVSDLIYRRGSGYRRAVVAGTLHLNFGDWQFWGADRFAGGLGTIAAERSTEVVDGLVRAFIEEHLLRRSAALLRTARPYPEVEFGRGR